MAMADLVMPRLPDQHTTPFYQAAAPSLPPAYQPHHAYNNPQISPLSTSNSTSPTSPKAYHTRQLRPMYMPAVLRPTEFPSKSSTAKQSPSAETEDDDDKALRSSNSFISLAGLSALGRLSRRSTGDSGKCMGGDWNLDLFPKVNALPKRDHWKPDQEATVCDEPTCKRYFSYFIRRHHCRRCGNIFCDWHSSYEIPLDEHANYNPRGTPSRACAHCYAEFKTWRSRTNSQASSDTSTQNGHGSATTPTSPIVASPTACGKNGAPKVPDAALSVPRDWNWSTF